MIRGAKYKFRLYVAGDTLNSVQAVTNLTALCQTHLPNRHEIEVVNVLRDPKRALGDAIFMTPALVRLGPLPVKKIVGTLSQTDAVLVALGLKAVVT